MKFEKWDYHFMLEAKLWSRMSKDPSRKIGAVIASGKKPLAIGYNGFPSFFEDKTEWLNNREEKYKRVIHAERNAILNALEHGQTISGSTIYVYGLPACSNCALDIIQCGIRKVIYCDLDSGSSSWSETNNLAFGFFKESGVEFFEMLKDDLDSYEKMVYK